jgi:hypothetical protein
VTLVQNRTPAQQPQALPITGVGTVTITYDDPTNPRVRIVLLPEFYCDLNDIDPCPPCEGGVLYLETDSITLTREKTGPRRKLNSFVEVLYHHDHDGDGIYDADDVINAIELAMSRTTEAPVVFRRPTFKDGIYAGLMMLPMPPAPLRHIAYSFGDIKRRFRGKDYLWAIPTFLLFIAIIQVQIYFVPWMKYSVISGYLAGMDALGVSTSIAYGLLGGFIARRLFFRKSKTHRTTTGYTYGFFSDAALWEEQVWREGAHRWTASQRIISCVSFGAIHMANLFYPLATILPLSIGGAVFMWIYLREYRKLRAAGRVHARRGATLKSAVAHRLYNRVALSAIVVAVASLVVWGGLGVLGLIAMVATVFATVLVDKIHWSWLHNRTEATDDIVESTTSPVTTTHK